MIALALLLLAQQPAPPLERLAFLAAAGDGGQGRAQLRYTHDDVAAMKAVLTGFGAFHDDDVTVVVDADRASFEEAFAAFDADVRARKEAGGRVEVVVYYSGHSDGQGLLLGEERLPWDVLRTRLTEAPADVRVLILDSCSSGALVRQKGGTHLPPFALDDGGVRGHAYLTSSRDDEPAQESDRVGGSFFTHSLVTGLRGAADASGDGRVTLHEAYSFAFQETLARTERAAGGTQHPAYDIQLAGSGDWVVTDLRDISAGLVLDEDLEGRVLVRDPRGRLVAELQKHGGGAVLLGLAPGRYDVAVVQPGRARTATLTLEQDRRTLLTRELLKDEELLATTLRGAAPLTQVFANVSLVPPLQTNVVVDGDVENAFGFHVLAGSQQRLSGLDLALGANIVTGEARGALLAVGGNVVGGSFAGFSAGVLGNVVAGDVAGAVAGVGANIVAGHVQGVQAGVGLNWAHGGFDVAQLAAGFNIGLGESRGLALAPVNIHDTLAGAQIGVINIGAAVTGAQIGVINIAGSTSGAQVGVVNIAGSSSATVGVVSIVGDGRFDVGVMGTDLTPAQAVLRMGSRSFYGVIGAGVSPWFEKDHTIVQLSAGPGVHLPLEVQGQEAFIDIEAVFGKLQRADALFGEDGLRLATTVRALAGWQLLPHLSIYAGPALNVLVLDERPAFVPLGWQLGDGGVTTTLSPGLALGVQL